MKRHRHAIFLVMFLALLVRLAYVLTLGETIYWEDEFDYAALGRSLAEGHGYVDGDGQPTAFRPVGYPLLLAALYKAGVRTPSEVRSAQAVLGVVSVLLVYLIADRLAGRRAALTAALYTALYPYFVFMTGTLFANLWFAVTLLAAVYAILEAERIESTALWGAGGLLLGFSTLSVTTAAPLAPVTLFWLFLAKGFRRRTLQGAAAFIAAFFVVVAPWSYRNLHELGTPMLSTNGGRNLWLGNNPATTINSGSNIAMPPELQARIDAASEVEADFIYTEGALAYIAAEPLRFIVRSLLKGAALWRFDPSPTTEGYKVDPLLLSYLSFFTYAPILMLAVVGFVKAGDGQKKVMLLWLFYFAVFTAVHALYISKVRFRLPLDHLLIIMAAAAMSRLRVESRAEVPSINQWKPNYEKEHALV